MVHLLGGFVITIMAGIVVWIVFWVVRPSESSEEEKLRRGKQRTQEMMATPEGRQWLADRIGGQFESLREGDEIPGFKPCPSCEGYGKLGHFSRIIKGAKVEFTGEEICKDCGGTGIEGGMDYENIACPSCDGKGAFFEEGGIVGAKCMTCQGTKVVQRDKQEKGETK